MTTTLRSDRRTRRNATFKLECLDDRIVLSAASAVAAAQAHLALEVSLGKTRAVEKASIVLHRDEVRLARFDANHPIVMRSAVTNSAASSTTTTGMTPMGPVSTDATVTAADPTTSNSTTTTISTPGGSTTSVTLPSNLGAGLQSLYLQYAASGGSSGSTNFSPTGLPLGMIINGNNVGIEFQTNNSDAFDKYFAQLESDGLRVSDDLPGLGIIEGMLPISALPEAGNLSASSSVAPLFQ